MNIEAIQEALREAGADAWLFYDHHYRDPIAYRILGLGNGLHVTRRWYYLVPANGDPKKLVHRIESLRLDALPGKKDEYSSWQELEAKLEQLTSGLQKIAMQYSPRNAIMYVSMVDAGTVEVLRGWGKEIVSSADMVSRFEAVLTEDQVASHYAAQQKLDEILAAGWQEMGARVRDGGIDEYGMVARLAEMIERAGMVTEHGPNVSVGPNSADSHYEPKPGRSRVIEPGAFVLIDIWAKMANDPAAIWYDITWTGVVNREPTEREKVTFDTVLAARDAVIDTIKVAYTTSSPIAGWQADRAARDVIEAAGQGQWFTHRTGHNIATELHGNGAHLDDLETHDERLILPMTCFSVEPGLYYPGEFGVRSEVNMLTSPGKAVVTGRIQRELVRI